MLKSSFNTTKNLKSFATYWLCLLSYYSFSQSVEKQTIRVEKMEYAYAPESREICNFFSNTRLVLPSDHEIADKMKQSILTAINSRWNAIVLNPKWDLKAINSNKKFKTNLKKKIPGNWHMFLQVIDNGTHPFTEKKNLFFTQNHIFQTLDYTSYYLQFDAQIIDGNDGSVLFSNKMMVEMQCTPVPAGQILLQKLPILADSFLKAFDTAIQTFFGTSPQSELKLQVAPACLFLDTDRTLANAKKLNFVSKNDSIIELLQLKQEWIIQNSTTQKTKRVNNFGNNLFNSSLTLLTGISTDKIREKKYSTKFGFIDTKDNTHYFCEIPFIEETREEREREVTRDANGSKSYSDYLNGNSSVKRSFNPNEICYLIREKDTIGNFKFIMGDRAGSKNNLSQTWDGKNDVTISAIPEFWKKSESSSNTFFLDGEINKIHFIIENGKAGNQTDIEIDNQEIISLKIENNKPVLGIMYSNPADEKIVSILLMLSTMPFSSIF